MVNVTYYGLFSSLYDCCRNQGAQAWKHAPLAQWQYPSFLMMINPYDSIIIIGHHWSSSTMTFDNHQSSLINHRPSFILRLTLTICHRYLSSLYADSWTSIDERWPKNEFTIHEPRLPIEEPDEFTINCPSLTNINHLLNCFKQQLTINEPTPFDHWVTAHHH